MVVSHSGFVGAVGHSVCGCRGSTLSAWKGGWGTGTVIIRNNSILVRATTSKGGFGGSVGEGAMGLGEGVKSGYREGRDGPHGN